MKQLYGYVLAKGIQNRIFVHRLCPERPRGTIWAGTQDLLEVDHIETKGGFGWIFWLTVKLQDNLSQVKSEA